MYGLQSAGSFSGCFGLLAIAFILFGSLPAMTPPAYAQSDMSWQYHRNLHQDPFQTRLTLAYGVPETDLTQFLAQCQIGNRGTYATIDIGAEIGTLAKQATAEVQFVGQGFNHVVTGTVIRPESEGISGVSIALQLDDPLWNAISAQSVLHYNVTGFTATKLPLGGSKRPTTRFLDDCREMPAPDDAAAAPPAAPTPQDDPRWATCDDLRDERSRKSDVPVTVTFQNKSDGYRGILWIDFNGRPVESTNLNPGESFTINTYVTHPWMFTDGPGNCLEMFMPQPGVSTFNITAPNRNFGPE